MTTSTNPTSSVKRLRSSETSFSQSQRSQSRKKKQRRSAAATLEVEASVDIDEDDMERDSMEDTSSNSSAEQCVTRKECIGTLSWIAHGVHRNNSLLMITNIIDDETYECVLLRRSDTSTDMINTQQIFSLPANRYMSVIDDKIADDTNDDDVDHDDDDDDVNTTSDGTTNLHNRPSAQLSLRFT